MKVCKGCDKLIIENDVDGGITSFYCSLRKEYVYRAVDALIAFPAPLDCDYEKSN